MQQYSTALLQYNITNYSCQPGTAVGSGVASNCTDRDITSKRCLETDPQCRCLLVTRSWSSLPGKPRLTSSSRVTSREPSPCNLAGGSFLRHSRSSASRSRILRCNYHIDLQFEENDVVVMTMPKSGTTWTQELVWTMRKNPNLDNPEGDQPLHIRAPILEADILVEGLEHKGHFEAVTREQGKDLDKGVFLNIARVAERPRIFKTHLSFPFLSDTALTKAKIVYTIRDPRDLCLSYYHHSKLFKYEGFTGTFDQYVDAFLEDSVLYGPYWSHVKEAWDRRHLPNLYVLFYEKMKKNPKEEISKLSQFLGVKLTDEQVDKIVHYTSFAEMKKRDDHCINKADEDLFLNKLQIQTEGGFFRSGTSGGWKKNFSQEQKDRFDAWIQKNCPDKEIMNTILNP
ncbi:Sulfotransferase domain [Trinorchestia longiramus]|nr:Sulfotransferase domain [Trinorchestia longiramus]